MEIIPMVMEGIELMANEKETKIGVYYASSIAYCMRKLYYSYIEPAKFDIDTQITFSQGIGLHSLIQRALSCYVKLHPEYKILNEPEDIPRNYTQGDIEIHGRPDSVLVDNKGHMHIVEVKSISNVDFLKDWRTGYYVAKEDSLMQLNHYLHCNPEATGSLLYVNKAKKISSNYRRLVSIGDFTDDEHLFQIEVNRAFALHECLIKGEIPHPEGYERGGVTDWECAHFCGQYKERCFKRIMQDKLGVEAYSKLSSLEVVKLTDSDRIKIKELEDELKRGKQ
jgi:hypothetical protein